MDEDKLKSVEYIYVFYLDFMFEAYTYMLLSMICPTEAVWGVPRLKKMNQSMGASTVGHIATPTLKHQTEGISG